MALIVKDRIKETTSTTGTGTLTLAGATTGFQTFAAIGDANYTYYAILNGSNWEVGYGQYLTSGTTLSRTTILESSNAGSAITLSGVSDVFCTYPAEKAVILNTSNQINDADVVITASILNANVTAAKLASDSVTTVKILDANVTTAKMADDSVNATKLNVTGDGTSGQALTSDADGSMTWTTVQAYDADTAKTDVDQTFSAIQTFTGITETQTTKSASFTPAFAEGTIYSCTSTMTITMPTATAGKSFTIIHATATSITWAGTIKWSGGSAPTADAGIDIYVFVSDGTNWYGAQSGTGFA